jgi:hypothetical protein
VCSLQGSLHTKTVLWLTINVPHSFTSSNVCESESGSSVSISVWLRAGRPGDRGSIPGRGERTFPLASVSRPALGPTQRPVQWVPGVLSPGLKRGQGVTLITHPQRVEARPPPPQVPSWCVVGQLFSFYRLVYVKASATKIPVTVNIPSCAWHKVDI